MPGWTLPPLPDLHAALRTLLREIPPGRVTTYGDLARQLGDVGAARWVAEALSQVAPDFGPSHRVVRKSGELPAGSVQREQLLAEGCPLLPEGLVDVSRAAFPLPDVGQPLQTIREWQRGLAEAVTLPAWSAVPVTIGGIDVSYAADHTAVAAYASVNVATAELQWSCVVSREVPFPYIPGYLTFREAPILLDLLAAVRRQHALDPVILVDGSGRLHPRRSGIAVAMGLLADCATIGVSKHQLCGQVTADRPVDGCPGIALNGEVVGAKLDGGSRRRTLYVSPGHGIDLHSAVRFTRQVWRRERWPLPIWQADRLSRAVAQTASIMSLDASQGRMPPQRQST
jgi:deoxyribonuclease V